MDKGYMLSGGRYPVLRAIGILYLFGACLVALAGLFAAAWALFGPLVAWMPAAATIGERIMFSVAILVGTFFAVLTLLAVAEGIKLFMDMANSLRLMACAVPSEAARIPVTSGTPGAMPRNRLTFLDDESAEVALIKGH